MRGHLAAIWGLMRGQRLRYFGAIVALIIASCFLYLAPLTTQVSIDAVVAAQGGAGAGAAGGESGGEHSAAVQRWLVSLLGGRDELPGRLWVAALCIFGFTCIAGVFTYLRSRWSAQASESIAKRVREMAYDKLQRLPVSYHDKAQSGDLIQRCTSDIETLRAFLANQVVEIGRASAMLIIPLPVMLAVDGRMTVASVVFIPPIIAFCMIYFGKIRRAFEVTDQAEGRMTTTIQENLTGVRVVRAFGRQDFEQEKFGRANGEHRDKDHYQYVLLAKFWSISDLMCFLQKAAVVAAGAYFLARGTLGVGEFFFFVTAVAMFIWPVRMMGRILAELGKAVVAIKRLREVLEEPEEAGAEELGRALRPALRLTGAVEFRGVRFAHVKDGPPALDGVSFAIPRGGTLGILGRSGSGKSTIVNLLLRLYEYGEGSITLDGVELRDIPREHIRSQCAVVMQEPFLYSRSVKANLTMARANATDDELMEATATAAVHSSVERFGEGYDTVVGERGMTLSGGQRQRLALARALLQEPAILIMDDSLSAVDTETEREILRALRSRRGSHTTIVIAHRVSTLMHADEVIVVEKGRIIQRGHHSKLVREEGRYRKLWELQTSAEGHGDESGSAVEVGSGGLA